MSGAPTRPQALQREVDELRREVQQLQQAVRQAWRPSLVDAHRDVRLAVTVDNGNYPSAGGSGHLKVPIKFVDGTFPQTSGWASISFADRTTTAKIHAAHVAADQYIAPGQPVLAVHQRAPTSVALNDTDGEWWILPHIGDAGGGPGQSTLIRVQANGFIQPGDTGKLLDKYTWDGDAWSDSGTDATCQNTNKDCCLIENEFGWAIQIDTDPTYELLPKGLSRMAVVNAAAGIDVGASGNVNLIDHSNGQCAGTEKTQSHTVAVCNGDANTNGHRKVFDDEVIHIQYYWGIWHIANVPRVRIFGKPQSNLQSGSSGTFDVGRLTGSAPTAWGTNTVTARNMTGIEMKSTVWYEIGWFGNSSSAVAMIAEWGC